MQEQEMMQDYWFRFVRTIDDAQEEPQKHIRFWTFIYETVGAAAAAVAILFIVFTFCFRGVGVQGDSMKPTLHDGDWLAVASLSTVKRNDIVILKPENYEEKPLVKRVIAKGGDVVNIDEITNLVYVNNELLTETYLNTDISDLPDSENRIVGDVQFPYKVPDGTVFVLGDNRMNSKDSRFSEIGCIDENNILGVVKYRVFPFDNLADLTVH